MRFPGPNSDDDSVRIEGDRAVVEKIMASIEDVVRRKESETAETIDVPPDKHRLLIGRAGQTRRKLESQFNVTIDIPKQNETGPARAGVRISGLAENVAMAKNHIVQMVQSDDEQVVHVPRRLHHAISDNGQFFRQLRNEHNVSVDHAGQQPPPRPPAWNPRLISNVGDMSNEDEDGNRSDDAYTWKVQDTNDDDKTGGEGDIPWVLRGSPEKVALAMQQIEAAREASERLTSIGYLMPPNPGWYRLVIGPGGSQVNLIRQKTGCKVHVPRMHTTPEPIEIRGERDQVEEAKEMILGLALGENQGRNGGRGNSRR